MIHWDSTFYQYLVLLTDVYLSLDGTVIPNHGYVEISRIGSTDDSALLCHTNFPPPPGSYSGGDWFAPDGTRVFGTDVPRVTRNRGAMVVRLKSSGTPPEGVYRCTIHDAASIYSLWWRTSGTPPEGIYRCTIQDANSTVQMVYVGLYNTGGGKTTIF